MREVTKTQKTTFVMDRGEQQRITVITETRNLRSAPFIPSEDHISTGKQWEERLESVEWKFRYYRINMPKTERMH